MSTCRFVVDLLEILPALTRKSFLVVRVARVFCKLVKSLWRSHVIGCLGTFHSEVVAPRVHHRLNAG